MQIDIGRSPATLSLRILSWSRMPMPNTDIFSGSRPMKTLRAIVMVRTIGLYW